MMSCQVMTRRRNYASQAFTVPRANLKVEGIGAVEHVIAIGPFGAIVRRYVDEHHLTLSHRCGMSAMGREPS